MRVYCAGIVLGVTLAAAVWLYTYEVWTLVEYIGRDGRTFRPAERVRVQPWWGSPAAVAAALVGAGISVWLLPERPRLLRRLSAHFANPS